MQTPASEKPPPGVETPTTPHSDTRENITEDDNSTTRSANLKEKYKDTPFLDNKGSVLHPDLAIVLAEIIPGVDSKDQRHSLFRSLVQTGIKCWDHFIDADLHKLENLAYKEKCKTKELNPRGRGYLIALHKLIVKRILEEDPEACNPKTYNKTMFRKFNIINQVESQRNLKQDLEIIDRDMGGSIDRNSKHTKSIAQERLERWTKTRRNKAYFPVLHKDEDH